MHIAQKMKFTLQPVALLAILLANAVLPAATFAAQVDQKNVAPAIQFFSSYCLKCHGSTEPQAGFQIEGLVNSTLTEENLLEWQGILRRLESRDMPPKGNPRPTETEYEEAVARISLGVSQVEQAALAKRPRAMRKLNRDEYANTIRDLFGIQFRPGDDFPSEGALYGFDTVADGLTLSPTLVEKYLIASSAVLDRALRPADPDHKPQTNKFAFYDEHYIYPQGTSVHGLGVYNGNAHMSFGPEGKKRVAYIGGPAIFAYRQIDPTSNPTHAFSSEGVYRLKVTLTPRNFEPGEVASFTVLGAEKRLVSELDIAIKENGKPITVEAEGYYDRSESLIGFEINWTNGNHLQQPSRGRLLSLAFDGSDQNKPWWHINYRMAGGKRVEWKPSEPEELPFAYFEKVEFEVTGPFRSMPMESADLLGSYDADEDASKVFKRFLPKAFRRPATQAEVARYVDLVKLQRNRGLDAKEALKVGLSAVLCSPHFLLLVETQPKDLISGSYQLNNHELAARLSYFIWSSCPDEELRQTADNGTLLDKKMIDKQVIRMLADSKSEAFANRFSRQWLNLDKLATAMPEPKLFPAWSDDLRDASRAETLAYFRKVLCEDLPITDFLASDWTVVNEDLAVHYGLPEVKGRQLREVTLTDERRGGLLSQAAILTLTSEATRTAPVLRGAYVLDRIFHRPPPLPPANVGSLIPDASQVKSVLEHLRIHRADIACAGCHAKFDGYGIAMENFDATGRWRTTEQAYEDPAKPVARQDGVSPAVFTIDAAVEMADGSKFDGIKGLKQHLLTRKVDFTRGLAERLTIYACGRGLTAADREGIEAIVNATAADGYKFQSMIKAVVDSPAFRSR